MSPLEREARSWLGTPFVDGASVKGAGCDCIGLMEALGRSAGLPVPERAARSLEDGLGAVLIRQPAGTAAQPGDVILLARERGGPPQHAALVTGAGTLIHAHWSQGVVENSYGRWFEERTVAVFSWPHPSVLQSTEH
jgi:NlpC/P60 family putative phage cell wall peptidase